MDTQRKKQLRMAYRERMPDMGVFAVTCKETGERFLGATKDFRADYNGVRVKLSSGFHPNKRLLELWNTYGEEGFDFAMVEALEYEDPHEDYSEELEAMRDLLMEQDPQAKKIWK